MSLYIDTSALMKVYVNENASEECQRILKSDPTWITARHTWVEVMRNLPRLLDRPELRRQEKEFRSDWRSMSVIDLDQQTCERAAEIARTHTVRTLDALHLAAAVRAGGASLPFVTYDLRQAQAARALGLTVLGS